MKALRLCIAVFALCGNAALASQTYNLVQGIDKFDGSDSAWRLLETNGFVVADPSYKYIFEPYLDPSLPPFITIDSAWETYQILLAAVPRQLESNDIPGAKFFAGIPPGATPSGLDFIEGAPEFASVPARRALSQFSDDSVERGVEALNYSWPGDSFAGRGLLLLSKLQVPPPVGAGALFQSDAWADELLWTQLGAWIEQSLPRRIRPQAFEGYQTPEESPKGGFVAPYPDFFAGLARLSRDTSQAMETAGMDEPSDSRAIAQKLLDCIFILQGGAGDSEGEITRQSTARIQFNQFAGRYMESHRAGGGDNSPASGQMLADVEAVARRCVAAGVPSAADRAVLQSFFDERLTAPRLLHGFATTCDKLAELARKCADGIALTGDDKKWISGYGTTLARFHFFPDNSPGAETNGPPVKRLAADSSANSVPWAGLGKPEALYVILPGDGRLRLYRGAVLSYREGIGTEANVQRASAPAFAGRFRAEKSASEILESLMSEAADSQDYRAIQENLETLQSRAVDADVPALIGALAKTDSESSSGPIPAGIAAAIARLNWARWQKELLALIDRNDGVLAGTISSILLHRPEWLDAAFLSANFDNSTPRYRRVYTLLLGSVPRAEQARAALLRALHDDSPAVRWQAVVAVTHASWDSPQKVFPLLERLADTNEFVAATAAFGLGKTGDAAVAPILFSNLQQRLALPQLSGALAEQRAAILDFALGVIDGEGNPFDPDNLLGRALMPRMRRPGLGMGTRRDQFNFVTALVEALGELHYTPAADTVLGLLDGRNASAAARALKTLAPDKLAARLLAVASDKNAQPQARDDALALLADAAVAGPMDGLVPLLDDRTVVGGARMMPGREWRICDRAAMLLATQMGRTVRLSPAMPDADRDEQIGQIRQWLKSAY